MKQLSILSRILASSMHLFSLLFTFFLPLVIYFFVRKKSVYFSFHAKESLNLHFTIFPIFLLLTKVLSKFWTSATIFAVLLLIVETILILVAVFYTLRGKTFSYPVIRYFKTH